MRGIACALDIVTITALDEDISTQVEKVQRRAAVRHCGKGVACCALRRAGLPCAAPGMPTEASALSATVIDNLACMLRYHVLRHLHSRCTCTARICLLRGGLR